jgi:hypothetical protein
VPITSRVITDTFATKDAVHIYKIVR